MKWEYKTTLLTGSSQGRRGRRASMHCPRVLGALCSGSCGHCSSTGRLNNWDYIDQSSPFSLWRKTKLICPLAHFLDIFTFCVKIIKIDKIPGLDKTVNLCAHLVSSLDLGFRLELWAAFHVLNAGYSRKTLRLRFGICLHVTGSVYHA